MNLVKLQRIFLYIFFFSINFEVWDPSNTGFFSISKFAAILYFFSILPHYNSFFRTKGLDRYLIPIWFFFGLLTVISLLHINYISSYYFDFSIFQNIILFILLINHARREPGILEKGILSFALGTVVLSMLYYFGIGVEYEGGRVSLFGDNENTIGIRVCISMVFISYMVFLNPLKMKKRRYLLLLFFPIMLSLMVETGSRVAFISFSLCFLVGVLLVKTKYFYGKVLIIIAGICVSVYLLNYVLSSEILYQRLQNSAQNRDLAGRDNIWASLFPILQKNPFFGVGTTGYALFTYRVLGKFSSPHNVILEILCYTGIVGLVAYLIFLLQIFRITSLKYRWNGEIMPALLLIPVLGLMLSGQLLNTKIGWIILAFCIGKSSSDKILVRGASALRY
jgi:O-antigen ligase